MTGMQQDAYQPMPQPGYQAGSLPYQQPIESMPAGPYENARDGEIGVPGETGRDLGVGDNRDIV